MHLMLPLREMNEASRLHVLTDMRMLLHAGYFQDRHLHISEQQDL